MNNFFMAIYRNQIWILLAFFLIIALGLFKVSSLNVSSVPDITNKQVVVITKTGSYSTEQIEKIITYPIESEMSGLPKIEEVRSLTKFGLSLVTIVFADDIDIYFARQLVTEKLQKVRGSLPEGISPQLAPVTTGLGEILMWTLMVKPESTKAKLSEKEKLLYLRTVQDYTIRPQLMRVPGVAEIDVNGGFDKELHINFFPERMLKLGVNTEEALKEISQIGISHGGGYITTKGEQMTILASTELDSIKKISELPIKRLPSGKLIRISDISEVRMDHKLRVGAATREGQETVLGTVLMRTGANSRRVANLAVEAIEQIALPDDVMLDITYNRKYLVDKTISTVTTNLLEGALLVIAILFLILGDFRASVLVSLSIPLSMVFAIIGMDFFGISANLMSLGAIDFGLLVDGSVVLVENALRRLHFNNTKNKMMFFSEAFAEVIKPVFFGLVIIMAVYVPILTLEGVEGKMFKPMALTVLLALAGSLIVAAFFIPVIAPLLIKLEPAAEHKNLVFDFIERLYKASLTIAMRAKSLLITSALVALTFGGIVFINLGADFIPQLDEGDLIIGVIRDSRQSIDESVRWQKDVEKVIMEFPEVEKVFSRIGTPESATDPMGPNFADTFVILKKNSKKTEDGRSFRNKSELFADIKKAMESRLPAQDISSTQPIEMRFNEILEGSRADVTMRIYGPELDKLLEYANKAKEVLQGIDGVETIEFDSLTGLTKSNVLTVEVDPTAAAISGFISSDVSHTVAQNLSGAEVGYFFASPAQRVPVVFHLDESLRENIEEIKKMPIAHPNGGYLPLSQLAKISQSEQVTTIARSWAQRYSAISLYLSGRDISSVVEDAKARVDQQLSLDSGYRIEWGGQFKNLQRAQKKLSIIVPLTLLVILLLIFKMTNSIFQTLTIFLAIPFGLIGGVFSLYLRGMNFSVSAAIGFIALSGIVILNSLVLVSFINQKLTDFKDADEAIFAGAVARLRPVLVTALVASLGFLPMALSRGMGAEVQKPLATVVIGGIASSTALTMIMIPIILSLGKRWLKIQIPD